MSTVVTARINLLTAAEVAEQLGVRPKLIYRLAQEKKLDSIRLGRKLAFTEQAVADFLAKGGSR